MTTTYEERVRIAGLDRAGLWTYQRGRLASLLEAILPDNQFYARKLADHPTQLDTPEALATLPFTTKSELIGGENAPFAANLTWPVDAYCRYHQTSGTHGRAMVVLDSAEDWQWWLEVWQYVLDAAAVTADDRAMLAFSFGPFIGFWSAHDALLARGAMTLPGGGLSTLARLRMMETAAATVVLCTPTYALRMAEVAEQEGFRIDTLGVRTLIVAGEPGGSVPSVRAAIENAWNAQVLDHSGASEVGPWGYGDSSGTGLWVNEAEYIAEFISVESGEPAQQGELAELVLTNLGRPGCPLIRYRTGDLVRPQWTNEGTQRFVFLSGGVLGRADDMLIIRGVNIFPSSIEAILREFPEIAEFRMTAHRESGLDRLAIEVEDAANNPDRIAQALNVRLGLNVEVTRVPDGALPRFEAKARRFIDARK